VGGPGHCLGGSRHRALTTEVLMTVSRPLASGVVAGLLAFAAGVACRPLAPLPRLVIETTVLLLRMPSFFSLRRGRNRSTWLSSAVFESHPLPTRKLSPRFNRQPEPHR
jgi:hypothetical protein